MSPRGVHDNAESNGTNLWIRAPSILRYRYTHESWHCTVPSLSIYLFHMSPGKGAGVAHKRFCFCFRKPDTRLSQNASTVKKGVLKSYQVRRIFGRLFLSLVSTRYFRKRYLCYSLLKIFSPKEKIERLRVILIGEFFSPNFRHFFRAISQSSIFSCFFSNYWNVDELDIFASGKFHE